MRLLSLSAGCQTRWSDPVREGPRRVERRGPKTVWRQPLPAQARATNWVSKSGFPGFNPRRSPNSYGYSSAMAFGSSPGARGTCGGRDDEDIVPRSASTRGPLASVGSATTTNGKTETPTSCTCAAGARRFRASWALAASTAWMRRWAVSRRPASSPGRGRFDTRAGGCGARPARRSWGVFSCSWVREVTPVRAGFHAPGQ